MESELSKELLDEYYCKKQEQKKLNLEVEELALKIKNILALNDRVKVNIHGYKITLKSKFEPNERFYKLLEDNKLSHLITKSITGNHLKSATLRLNLSDRELQGLLVEKTTKWLYVEK